MRAFRMVLMLFTVLGAAAAFSAPPDLPVPEGYSFTVPVDTLVRAHAGSIYGPAKLFTPGASHNCALELDRSAIPAGTPLTCEVAPPAVFQSCYPDPDFKWTWTYGWVSSGNYHYGDVPASVGAGKPYIGWWIDTCTQLYRAQYFNKLDIAELILQKFANSAAINAYVASQPLEDLTEAENTYELHLLEVLNQQVALPPVKPPCVVAFISAGTRPYGTPNSTNTGIVKKGDIAVGIACDATLRLGMTNYYSVAGQKGTKGETISVGFALGTLQ